MKKNLHNQKTISIFASNLAKFRLLLNYDLWEKEWFLQLDNRLLSAFRYSPLSKAAARRTSLIGGGKFYISLFLFVFQY